MGKKEKKSKTAEQKARVAARQNKKAAQKDKKSKTKGGDESDGEDIDLESVLEDYAKKVCLVDYFYMSGPKLWVSRHALTLHVQSAPESVILSIMIVQLSVKAVLIC